MSRLGRLGQISGAGPVVLVGLVSNPVRGPSSWSAWSVIRCGTHPLGPLGELSGVGPVNGREMNPEPGKKRPLPSSPTAICARDRGVVSAKNYRVSSSTFGLFSTKIRASIASRQKNGWVGSVGLRIVGGSRSVSCAFERPRFERLCDEPFVGRLSARG